MFDAEALPGGLSVLGGLHPAGRALPGIAGDVATLVLIGWRGQAGWRHFAAEPEAGDGFPDPLDRWTARVVDGIARACGARPLYPFAGPPWHPFQSWALAAGIGHKSPIGVLVDADYGPWISFRAALAFADVVDLPERRASASPCDSCSDRPCLSACPVGAYSADGFAVGACRTHLRGAGTLCLEGGCLARHACPVGRTHRQSPAQLAFHQRAFVGGVG